MLFTFPSRYWFTIGLSGVFSLTGWAPLIHAEFLVLRATQDYTGLRLRFVYRAFTFSGAAFQRLPLRSLLAVSCSFYPGGAETPPVWALPRSLATTCGITVVFFSCGYLDVSVPRVRLPDGMTGLLPAGLPHSDIPGSRVICTSPGLFAAYHVLLRLREPRHPPSALAYFLRLSPDSCPSGEQVDMSLACSSFCHLSSLLEVVQYVKDLLEGFIPLSVENNGFEPLTLCLQSRCSSQLS